MTTHRILRSATAGAALSGGIAALPYLLLRYAGSPIPSTAPSPARVLWWLRSGQFDDHAAVVVLGYVLWACWAIFTMQVAVQLPGALRNATRVRSGDQAENGRSRSFIGGGAVQILLTTLLVTMLAPRSTAAASTGPSSASISAAPAAAVAAMVPGQASGTTADTEARVHIVQDRDTLWDIAAHYLGDGNRWPELYQHNVGVPQPDGQVLTNPDIIVPGWRLTLPPALGDATANGPAQVPAVPHHDDATQHDPEPTQPSPIATVNEQTPAETTRDAPTSVGDRARVAPRDRVAISLGADGYVGIALAAGVAAALTAARLRRRARGRSHFPIPLDPESEESLPGALTDLERAHLVTLAPPDHGYIQDEDDPSLAEWVDAELPPPAHHPADEYGLPLLGAASEQELITTRKAMEAPTSIGWGTGTDGHTVAFPLDGDANAVAVEGDGAEAALRALIVAASATEGVPECGTATHVVTTVAVMEQVFGTAELPRTPRLHIKVDLKSALDSAEDAIAERRTLLRALGLRNATEVRRFKPDHLMQPLLLITQVPEEDGPRLTDVIEAGRGLDINAVVLGTSDRHPALTVAADGIAVASGEQTSALNGARLFHLSSAAAQDALNLVLGADLKEDSTPEPAVSTAPSMPAQRTAETPMANARVGGALPPVRLEVFDGLGVVVDGNDMVGRFRARLRTLVAYLAVHPDGATRPYLLEEICALEVTEKTRRKLSTELNEIRKVLRTAVPAAAEAMILDDDPRTQRLRFDPSLVTTDLDLFAQLLADANQAPELERAELLTDAIRLYQGPVLPTMDTDWVEPVREQQRRRALDAHHELVRLVEAQDPAYAVHLLEQALDVDPFNIETYQCLMSRHGAMGNRNKVRQVFELLDYRMGQLDEEVDAESRDLYEEISGREGAKR